MSLTKAQALDLFQSDDLIGIGFRPGPELGLALRRLLDDVVRTPDLNTRDELLRRAKALRP